jgi:hypothetical protein
MQMTISGITYEVLGKAPIAGFAGRFEICLRRLGGKRKYHVVQYENGTFSKVV